MLLVSLITFVGATYKTIQELSPRTIKHLAGDFTSNFNHILVGLLLSDALMLLTLLEPWVISFMVGMFRAEYCLGSSTLLPETNNVIAGIVDNSGSLQISAEEKSIGQIAVDTAQLSQLVEHLTSDICEHNDLKVKESLGEANLKNTAEAGKTPELNVESSVKKTWADSPFYQPHADSASDNDHTTGSDKLACVEKVHTVNSGQDRVDQNPSAEKIETVSRSSVDKGVTITDKNPSAEITCDQNLAAGVANVKTNVTADQLHRAEVSYYLAQKSPLPKELVVQYSDAVDVATRDVDGINNNDYLRNLIKDYAVKDEVLAQEDRALSKEARLRNADAVDRKADIYTMRLQIMRNETWQGNHTYDPTSALTHTPPNTGIPQPHWVDSVNAVAGQRPLGGEAVNQAKVGINELIDTADAVNHPLAESWAILADINAYTGGPGHDYNVNKDSEGRDLYTSPTFVQEVKKYEATQEEFTDEQILGGVEKIDARRTEYDATSAKGGHRAQCEAFSEVVNAEKEYEAYEREWDRRNAKGLWPKQPSAHSRQPGDDDE